MDFHVVRFMCDHVLKKLFVNAFFMFGFPWRVSHLPQHLAKKALLGLINLDVESFSKK